MHFRLITFLNVLAGVIPLTISVKGFPRRASVVSKKEVGCPGMLANVQGCDPNRFVGMNWVKLQWNKTIKRNQL